MEAVIQQYGEVPYDGFASFYNRNLGRFAERLLPVLDDLFLRHLPSGGRILDVCCGTGQLAFMLRKRGFAVVGVDESSEMLRLARCNAPDAEFIQAKASSFELAEAVDGVVSTFDSINHVLNIKELEEVFSCVHRYLKNDGYLVFDVNMEEGYLSRWDGHWQGRFEEGTYDIKAIYDKDARIGRNEIKVNKPDSEITRQWEICEHCYSEQEIRETLKNSGFAVRAMYDGHQDLGLFGEWGRSFFVCQKATARLSDTGVAREPPKEKVKYRSVRTCILDGVYPGNALRRELGEDSLRLNAISEVLCRFQPAHYDQLYTQAPRFSWFIPAVDVLGQVHPFPVCSQPSSSSTEWSPHSRVVYLSPLLEQHKWPIVVIAVAHELVHVILNHELVDLDGDTYRRQEREVSQKLVDWGFQDELTAAVPSDSIT